MNFYIIRKGYYLSKRGVVLSEVLVRVSVIDSRSRVALGESLAGSLAVSIVISATVSGEVGGLVDDGSALSGEYINCTIKNVRIVRTLESVPVVGASQKAPHR